MAGRESGATLPPAARARLAEINASGTWSSALSTDQFAAIKSVGFEPVGQVLGAAVYNIGFPGGTGCPTYGIDSNSYQRARLSVYTVVSGSGASSAYGPLVNALYSARRMALRRMAAECLALGGHGVVGVSLTLGPFPAGGIEFKAIGTAVRAPGGVRLKEPFTSHLSGQDFAKLIQGGVVPVSLVLGISIGVRHDDWLTKGQARWSAGNAEVAGYTELVNRTRDDARNELKLDVSRVCGDGVVVSDLALRIGEHECKGIGGRTDHVAEVTMLGTAIVRFRADRKHFGFAKPMLSTHTTPVLSLDPERRRAARGASASKRHGGAVHALGPDMRDDSQDAQDAPEEQQ